MSTTDSNEQEHAKDMVQLLVFSLSDEEYALNLTEAQEIVDVPDITPVPNMPDAVKGVANLRGRIVTVIDMETLFGIKENGSEKEHVIVAEKDGELFGLLVDTAEEVLRTTAESLRETPDLLKAHPHAAYLRGVVVIQEKEIDDDSDKDKELKDDSERIILALNLEAILKEFNAVTATDTPKQEQSEEAAPEQHQSTQS